MVPIAVPVEAQIYIAVITDKPVYEIGKPVEIRVSVSTFCQARLTITRPGNASPVLYEDPLQAHNIFYFNVSADYLIGLRIVLLEVWTPFYRNHVYTEFEVVQPDLRP